MTTKERDELQEKLDNIEKGLDRLIIYLSLANQPDCPEEVRKTIDEMIETYLQEKNTSLEEIMDREFGRGEGV